MSGLCVWFTGNTEAGKTTILNKLVKMLNKQSIWSTVFDGTPNQDADELVKDGKLVIIASTSFLKAERAKERKRFGDKYVEVFVDTPLDVCKARDSKKLYSDGWEYPPYEPDCAELVLHTTDATPQENAEIVYNYIKDYL